MRQLRTLELSGRPCQVLLESWRERDRCCSAPTPNEMVAQALSLSEIDC